MALSLTGDSTMYAVLAHQTEVVGISLAAVGVLLGINRLIRIPGNLLAGALNDQMKRRRLFLLGLLLGILSTLSYGLVRGFWPLLASRMLWGTAWALINVTGYTMIIDWSTPADRGRMAGFYQMAFMLGLAISPMLGGVLTDALGFRSAVRICAVVSSIGFVLALVALPETRPDAVGPKRGFWGGLQRHRLTELVGVWRQADRRILLAAYIYLVTLFVNSGVLMSTISLYLGQRWGTSIVVNGLVIGVASLAGVMLAARALLGMLAGPLAGVLSDRAAHRRDDQAVHQHNDRAEHQTQGRVPNRWPVVRGGILLGVLGFVILFLPLDVWAAPVGIALVSLSAGALVTGLVALVGDSAGQRPGATMGGLATAGDMGSAMGPLVAYALAVTLDLRWVYLLCALALASGMIATVGQGKTE
jgi:MFS family permease